MAQYTVLWVLGGDDAADELAHQADGLLGGPALAAATATRVAADDLIAAPKSHLRGVCAAWLLGVDDDQQYEVKTPWAPATTKAWSTAPPTPPTPWPPPCSPRCLSKARC